MSRTYKDRDPRPNQIKVVCARNPKPIIAEVRHGVLRPTGGSYFRPYFKKLRMGRMWGRAAHSETKRMVRRQTRREARKCQDY